MLTVFMIIILNESLPVQLSSSERIYKILCRTIEINPVKSLVSRDQGQPIERITVSDIYFAIC